MAQYQVLLYLQGRVQALPDYQGVCTVSNLYGGSLSPEDAHQLLLDVMFSNGVPFAAVGSVVSLDGSGFQYQEDEIVNTLLVKEVL